MKRILFIVQLPPPTHGVSVMNLYAVNNPLITNSYKTKILPLHFGQKLNDFGKITFRKLMHLVGFVIKLILTMVIYRPHLVYFTIMPTGKVFYRDALFIRIIKLFSSKIIIHLHGKGIKEAADRSPFIRRLYKKTFNNVNLICLSQNLTNDIETIYDSKPFILANGIEINNIFPFNKADNKIPTLIFLSNLSLSKGIQTFVNSLAELRNQNILFSVKIVGDSMDYTIEETKKFIKAKGLSDQVKVLGPKFGKEKIDHLSQADIFVLPSFNECFPLTILEAMQVGLPIVATKIGGIPDMIKDNVEGLLIDLNKPNDLSEKLKSLILDPDLRKRLGKNAQERFNSQFTIRHFNEGLYRIFENVINSK